MCLVCEMTRPAPALPFYFYDILPMTGVTVDTAAFMLLAKERLQGFVGIKFTNQDLDLLARCMNHESVKADILFGTDERLIEGLALGCAGGVGSTYNFAAPLYRRIIDAYNRGDMEAAQADQARSVKMIERMFQSGFGGVQGGDGFRRGRLRAGASAGSIGCNRKPRPACAPTSTRWVSSTGRSSSAWPSAAKSGEILPRNLRAGDEIHPGGHEHLVDVDPKIGAGADEAVGVGLRKRKLIDQPAH